MNLKEKIRDIENYPKEGIIFRDITTLLSDKASFRHSIEKLSEIIEIYKPDKIVGIEARGFILGAPVAYNLDCGFIPVRKKGKLPYNTISESYGLEYGDDIIEIHTDSILPGETVVIIDDLLATGGTCKAAINLIEKLGGKVPACVFLVELTELNGREILKGYDVEALIKY